MKKYIYYSVYRLIRKIQYCPKFIPISIRFLILNENYWKKLTNNTRRHNKYILCEVNNNIF